MRIFFKRMFYWFTQPQEIEIDLENDYRLLRAIPKKYTGKVIFKNSPSYLHDDFWYLKDGLFHREDGPAIINAHINYNGTIHTLVCVKSQYSRTSYRIVHGTIESIRYYIDGQCYYLNGHSYPTKEEWFDALTEEQQVKALFNLQEWR